MKPHILFILLLWILLPLLFSSCSPTIPSDAEESSLPLHIYPDYTSVTLPYNIAPLNFKIEHPADEYLTVLRGRHEYNRYTAAVLERIGLGELVADSRDQWTELCLRLIDDDAYLADVTARVRAADLDAAVFRLADADNLRRCFDTLIAHHDSFRKEGSRKPIEIQ